MAGKYKRQAMRDRMGGEYMNYDELYAEWARLSDMERRLHRWYMHLQAEGSGEELRFARELFERLTGSKLIGEK